MEKVKLFIQKNHKICLIIFFLFLYIFGITHLKNVGINYDEGTEQSILKMNDYAIH